MNLKARLSYGMGGLGKNIAFTIVSTYTLYYYNTVLGVSASFIGTILMIARLFDAFNDPFMGVIVEKTNSKYGKYAPWILSGAVLNAFVMFAMFSVPDNLSSTGVKFYIAITYFLCGITYTLSDIPYWSIIPAITHAGKSRERVTLVARTFTGAGTGVATVFTMSAVAKLGGGTSIEAYRLGFSLMAAIVALFYIVTTILTVVFLPRENSMNLTGTDNNSSPSVKHLLNALIHNDQALVLSLIVILFYSATSLTLATIIYEFDFDLLQPNRYSSFMAVMGLVQFAGMSAIFILLRRFMSYRAVLFTACVLAIAGYGIFAVEIPLANWSYALLLIPSLSVALANGIVYVLVTILVANAVDYGEKKTGLRENSMVSALQTLMVKFASAISALIVGIGIDLVGFTNDTIQPADTIFRLHTLMAVPPLILVVAATLILYKRKDI